MGMEKPAVPEGSPARPQNSAKDSAQPEEKAKASEAQEKDSVSEREAQRHRAADEDFFWTACQQALHERERRERVGAFLQQHGFSCVNSRKGFWKYTYPLHRAAIEGDASLVKLLLESRAVCRQRDSEGRTARQVAQAADEKGSHSEVFELLTNWGRAAQSRGVTAEPPQTKNFPAVRGEMREACVQCDHGELREGSVA